MDEGKKTEDPVITDTEKKDVTTPVISESENSSDKDKPDLSKALSEKNKKIQALKDSLEKLEAELNERQETTKTTEQQLQELKSRIRNKELESHIKDYTKESTLKSLILAKAKDESEIDTIYAEFSEKYIPKSEHEKLLSEKNKQIEKLTKDLEKLGVARTLNFQSDPKPIKKKRTWSGV